MKPNRIFSTTAVRNPLARLASIGLLGCAVAFLMACQPGSNVTTGGPDPSGNYSLVSVDGRNVPCETRHGGHTLTIKSGTFAINPDGTCLSVMKFTPPNANRDVNREVKATYKQSGSKLTMKWQGAGVTSGTLSGDTFTMQNEGMVLAYRK